MSFLFRRRPSRRERLELEVNHELAAARQASDQALRRLDRAITKYTLLTELEALEGVIRNGSAA
jgi:hypothetical protein